MSQYVPAGGFKWLTYERVDKLDLENIPEDSKKGMILEVDLQYPKEFNNLHNYHLLAPEQIKVTKDKLSPYCQQIQSIYQVFIGQVYKLIPTLVTKEKYVLHDRNLQLYMSLGLKLKKIHRALEFKHRSRLAQYIDYNTKKRMVVKNAFKKDFFKLMKNSEFGKTMENLHKRVDVKLVSDHKKFLKMVSKPTYVGKKEFTEDLVAVHKIKETLVLNRTAYVGMCILDLSKTLLYDFHYDYIKKKYGSRAKLGFTETDSLCYEITTKDAYKDFWADKHKFDNRDYPKESPFFDPTNNKVIGKFKDEAAVMPIVEFIRLKSKMYSYVKHNGKNEKTCKGVKKDVIKKNITH